MNVKALTLAGVTVGVAVATTVILNLVAPIHHEQAPQHSGVTVDEIFNGTLAAAPIATATAAETEVVSNDAVTPAEPVAAEPVAAEAPAAMETAAASSAPVQAGSCAAAGAPHESSASSAPALMEVAQADVPSEAPAEFTSTEGVDVAPAEPAMDAGAPADASAAPVSAAGACNAAVPSGDQRVVVAAGGLPDSPAPSSEAAMAPSEPAMAASEPEPAPASEPAYTPPPEPVSEPVMAAAEPAPAPAPAPKPAAKPRKPKPPAEVKKAWWPAKEAGKLNLTYAGEASFTKAIALLFDGAFESPESANQNIVVKTKSGKVVKGTWFVSPNKQMLLFNVDPGVYNVEVGAGLTDKGNRTISAAAAGPVYVP